MSWTKILLFLAGVSALAFIVIGAIGIRNDIHKTAESLADKKTFSGSRYTVGPNDIFGTAANKITLSGSFATSTCFDTRDIDKLVVAGTYIRATANATVSLWVSATLDKTPTPSSSMYFPLSSTIVGTTEVDVYSDSGTGGGGLQTSSSTGAGQSGLPWFVPGDKNGAAGQAVSSTFIQIDTFAYSGVCIEPVESVSSGNGKLWLQYAGKAGI